MKCTDNKGNTRLCPYRVFREEHKAMSIGGSDVWSESFYNCKKTLCIAYDEISDECRRLKIEAEE